jgi:acetone carboxylase gamma subunit
MSVSLSGSLAIIDMDGEKKIACQACERPLVASGEPWKPSALVKELPMQGAGGDAYASADHVVLRQFYCPGCAALLDTETAMSEDPFLNDVIKV